MFTGIVESLGAITDIERKHNALRLTLAAPSIVDGTRRGDSICVSGVCLTVTETDNGSFACDVIEETLQRSNLRDLSVGSSVNLERSLRPDSRLGGHFVMGHVDAVGVVSRIVPEGESQRVFIQCPGEVARYLVEKGSVAVDGVSLTVVDAGADYFSVALIPHTRKVTTLGRLTVGSRVNLEVDMIAKYVEKLTQPFAASERQKATDARLKHLLSRPSQE